MVKEVQSEGELPSLIRSTPLVVADFFATWCGPCQRVAPEFERLSSQWKNGVAFVKVDVDKFKGVAQSHQIQAMPTFVIFKNGSEVGRVKGASIDQVKALVEKHAPQQLFAGAGQTLGGGGGGTAPAAPQPPSAAATSGDKGQSFAPPLDEGKASTTIQLRLHDGHQISFKINTDKKVQELFSIAAKASRQAETKFRLISSHSFPPKSLESLGDTLEAAGVTGCMVTMKMK
uniref:Thioredoxin domain-containing protein n=1 Tax=Chromera velia CCMP2878 TaxID=1169474 RepID=A0A0G4GDB9_9ALVE|mmetsp:Transcript_44071/g.87005  ORF Transcript_44071/g.87005 Transcript_44071/m.87005 type:complete len:231 (-) Transcript_44071:600-1292(-)|eukprot:Cvel_621.t1-p1 / transcript=Cvel_621.t1 / gene=Cvel_621 / organism=Chromera_velia_CCMP2878 / gene_product=Thioredoxin, putative / transcript_product=Thioredoxin, putative / location=Cvel_scaffold19:61688-63894(+) / protein_length=230 / sequence_SO=supercontig / SO=protein_coding / is_pseudo=false